MRISLIVFFVLPGLACWESNFVLTKRENENRIESCGDHLLGETLWLASLFDKETYNKKLDEYENMGNGSTTLRQIPATNAVFIFHTQLLTTSSWFIVYNQLTSSWIWKNNGTPLGNSICEEDQKASYHTKDIDVYVLDSRKRWRRVVEVIFLRYCEFKNESSGFLTLVVVDRDEMIIPIICLPKLPSRAPQERIQNFQYQNVSSRVNNVTKCETSQGAQYYTVGKDCADHRGSPLVKTDRFEHDRLTGVITIVNPKEVKTLQVHIIEEYMVEMCKVMGICSRKIEKLKWDTSLEEEWKIKQIRDQDYVEIEDEPPFEG